MTEIFNIPSKKVKDFLNDNSNNIVLDVRTEEEWNSVGKPDAELLNSKTLFISLLVGPNRIKNENFIKEFLDKKISKKDNILVFVDLG